MSTVPLRLELWYDGQWNDHTDRLRAHPSPDGGVHIERGRSDWGQRVQFGVCRFSVNNRDGIFSFRNPVSSLYGKIGLNTPVRLSVDHPGIAERDRVRFVGEIRSLPQRWIADASRWVPIEAVGILRRLGKGSRPLESAIRRHVLSMPHLVSYLPLEDGAATIDAEQVVAGATTIRYRRGAPPDFPYAPRWGGDSSCPGSAPLPEWPPLTAFSWAETAAVAPLPPTGPWGLMMAVRVPPSSGLAMLCEWYTSGRLRRWQLQVSAEGILQVAAGTDDDDDPTTAAHVATNLGRVDDGNWRSVAIVVTPLASGYLLRIRANDSVQQFTNITATAGRITRHRPRPLFQDPDGKEPIGLGHALVIAESASVGATTAFFGEVLDGLWDLPVTGWDGETAAGRAVRLGLESGVPIQVRPGPALVDDSTERIINLSQFDIDGLVLPELDGETELDVLLRASCTGDRISVGVLTRTSLSPDADVGYLALAMFGDPEGFPNLAIFNGGIREGQWPGGDLPLSTLVWIRVQTLGHVIRMRVWLDGDVEPREWHVWLVDAVRPGPSTAIVALSEDRSGTVTIDRILVRDVTTQRMGPQRPAKLLDLLEQAAEVDCGILHETRDELGLTFRPLCSITNQPAAVELDYQAGDVHEPFNPVDDDQGVVNELRATRPDGGSATVRDEAHQVVHGEATQQVTVHVQHDTQLAGQAGWRVHVGTAEHPRWPAVGTNPARMLRRGQVELVAQLAAVESGDRLVVTGVPDLAGVDQIVQGYAEALDDETWTWVSNNHPAAPFEVGVVAADDGSVDIRGQRVDTDHTVLAVAIDETETTIEVATDLGVLGVMPWTTDPTDWDVGTDGGGGLVIDVGGEWMRVTDITGDGSTTQQMTVIRSINGIVKAHPAGTRVRVAHPIVVAL